MREKNELLPNLEEIAVNNGLNPEETTLFLTCMNSLNRGIIQYHTGDPEGGLETIEIWINTLNMYSFSQPTALAIAEALLPLADAMTPKKRT